jgi:hypothetical protein
MIVAFEGPDRCGKSQIATELASRCGYAYFKNSGEWNTDLRTPEYFKNLLVYGGTFLTDFLCQVKPNVLLDRYYPSEWVYSRVFGRESDEKALKMIDTKFAEAGGRIVLCRRKSYDGIKDDVYDYVDEGYLKRLDASYEDFLSWTVCPVLTLWVDDENLEREISEIRNWSGL